MEKKNSKVSKAKVGEAIGECPCQGCPCQGCPCSGRPHRYYYGKRFKNAGGNCGGVYFFGLIGAAIYFIGQATSFGAGVLGFLKALVWPVFLVYEALKVLLG